MNIENQSDAGVGLYGADMVRNVKIHSDIIKAELDKEEKSFFVIAYSLTWINDNKGFVSMGYNTFSDFVRDEYNIKKSTAYNYVKVVHRFGVKNDDGIYSDIAEDYKGYGSSKLSVMESMTDEEIAKCGISPQMSVREISKVKRKYIQSLLGADFAEASECNISDMEDDAAGYIVPDEVIMQHDVSGERLLLASVSTYSDFIALMEDIYPLAHGYFSSNVNQDDFKISIYAEWERNGINPTGNGAGSTER